MKIFSLICVKFTQMKRRAFSKWFHWLVIYPLAGVGTLVALFFVALLFEDASSSRTRTAIDRMTSDVPYYEYGYTSNVRNKERGLAEQMKTWDSTCQLVSWDDLAASILRGDRPQSDFGCIYKEGHDCRGCHVPLMKVFYQDGWLTMCPNCRNQMKYKQVK